MGSSGHHLGTLTPIGGSAGKKRSMNATRGLWEGDQWGTDGAVYTRRGLKPSTPQRTVLGIVPHEPNDLRKDKQIKYRTTLISSSWRYLVM